MEYNYLDIERSQKESTEAWLIRDFTRSHPYLIRLVPCRQCSVANLPLFNMTTTTTTATSCTICTLCRRLWDVEALAPADWDAVTEVASEHGNTDTGTTAASVLATCSSCLGILQKPSLPHEVVRTIAAGIQQRGYDARTFKLEFMTKEFEGIRRPIERTAGGKFPSLVKIKDSFRQRVKDRFGGDPVLQNLEWRTSSDNGALLISIHLVDLAQSARANDADCTNPKKRTRRQQRQKNNGGGRTLGNASQVQNSSQEQIPSDHQTYCLAVSKAISVKVRVFREPVFVYGRYIKCSRRISQTPWVINGSRKGVSSVEEALAGPILDKFKPTTYKFHSAGREDYNVRMCGNGRPFIFELIDSTKGHLLGDEYKNLELAMNSREQSLVRVNSLREATSEFQQLKDGAETKRKSYRLVAAVACQNCGNVW